MHPNNLQIRQFDFSIGIRPTIRCLLGRAPVLLAVYSVNIATSAISGPTPPRCCRPRPGTGPLLATAALFLGTYLVLPGNPAVSVHAAGDIQHQHNPLAGGLDKLERRIDFLFRVQRCIDAIFKIPMAAQNLG